MLVLFDNNVHERFARLLVGHDVKTAYQLGWAQLSNGRLIEAAEEHGFPVVITADKSLSYQQNLKGRPVTIITLAPLFSDYVGIAPLAAQVLKVLENLPQGEFVTIRPEPPA